MTKLTPAQQRLLDEVRAKGTVVKNGRARKPIEALEAAGLVVADWDLVPAAIGPWYWRITVTPVPDESMGWTADEVRAMSLVSPDERKRILSALDEEAK